MNQIECRCIHISLKSHLLVIHAHEQAPLTGTDDAVAEYSWIIPVDVMFIHMLASLVLFATEKR